MTLTADPTAEQRLDIVFAALANATRRAMLARLAEGEASVNELAAPFALSLPAVSKHLKVLEHAGLITRGRNAQFRPCALRPDALGEVSSWADRQRATWERRLDRMETRLERQREEA
ncbi:ArsR/SmtB family transcription factor [Nocardioides coralli]|uniref:ArsR/SmtB family transcription factor n=1 Tax=Nocardioides coralli TaxID=2872154 RepID=UPI001CA3B947|nr:metalloregulator ArsR/SmtB family transcription factor [Nocardioides coralli]QZY29512.1 metalloregulator ArsR/SmtB family transcription factor [Nocardioides coralli]